MGPPGEKRGFWCRLFRRRQSGHAASGALGPQQPAAVHHNPVFRARAPAAAAPRGAARGSPPSPEPAGPEEWDPQARWLPSGGSAATAPAAAPRTLPANQLSTSQKGALVTGWYHKLRAVAGKGRAHAGPPPAAAPASLRTAPCGAGAGARRPPDARLQSSWDHWSRGPAPSGASKLYSLPSAALATATVPPKQQGPPAPAPGLPREWLLATGPALLSRAVTGPSLPGSLLTGGALCAGVPLRTGLAGRWRRDDALTPSGGPYYSALELPSLLALARQRSSELQVVETDDSLELTWVAALGAAPRPETSGGGGGKTNASASGRTSASGSGGRPTIARSEGYPKGGGVVLQPRADGRPGAASAQLMFSIEGNAHIKAVQGEPAPMLLHTKIRMSTGGSRLRVTERAQRLDAGGRAAAGAAKHTSYWCREQ